MLDADAVEELKEEFKADGIQMAGQDEFFAETKDKDFDLIDDFDVL